MKSMKSVCGLGALAVAAACITGCSTTSPDDVSYGAIAHDLSPELRGLTERSIDVNRHINVTADVNSRLAEDDLNRVFYTDHPSRLTPYPVTGTSGVPR